MKCKLGMFVVLLLCMSVCIGAQAVGEVKVEPAGLGLGSYFKQYPVYESKEFTISNNTSETVYLKQPESDVIAVGPLSKTELAPGEKATFSVTARFDLPSGEFYTDNIPVCYASGAQIYTVRVQYYLDDRPDVLLGKGEGEGEEYFLHPTSVWQGNGDYVFINEGFDIQVWVCVSDHYKPGKNVVIRINGEEAEPEQDEPAEGRWLFSFPDIEGDKIFTVEGIEPRPLIKPNDGTEQNENALGGIIENPDDDLFGELLQYAEEYAIDHGAKYVVWLEVSDAEETTKDIDKRLIHSVVNEQSVTHYLDINLLKQIGKGQPTMITDVDGNVVITLEIPKGHRDAPELMYRNFGVVRLHDGVAEKLYGQYSPETGLLTFKTDRFSSYALFYEDLPMGASEEEMKPLVLPDSLTKIEAEAFRKTDFSYVICPDTLVSIESRAFAECEKLMSVIIPSSTTTVAADAFEGCTALQVIAAPNGSPADRFAQQHGYAPGVQ